MAREYLRADEHALFRLAVLVDNYWTKPSAALASEIRLQQQAFGLTPLDRRRLEWSIEQVEAAQNRVKTKRASKPLGKENDPRDALRHDMIILPGAKIKNAEIPPS